MADKLKEIDKRIAKHFEGLESEINKRSEITPERQMSDLGSMSERLIKAMMHFDKIKTG